MLREDFADKLLWSFEQAYNHQPDFDIFLLNWYCNSGHWKDCDKNKNANIIASKPFDRPDQVPKHLVSQYQMHDMLQMVAGDNQYMMLLF